jgi:hypothetical protein
VPCNAAPGECYDPVGTCSGVGQCAYTQKIPNTACTDDGNECTADVCDGAGNCTHPTAPADNASCGSTVGYICCGGSCVNGLGTANCGTCGHHCGSTQRCCPDGSCIGSTQSCP